MPDYKSLEKKFNKIEQDMGDIRQFEAHFDSIASKIKAVEIAPLKFRGDDLSLDLRETRKLVKQHREGNVVGTSWKETMERLNDIADTAQKFAGYTNSQLSMNQQRARLLEDMLVSTRDSARFQGMMTSAYNSSKSRLESEEELFYMVVKEGMSVPGIDKRGLISRLNAKLEAKGYMPIDKAVLEAM